MNNHFFTGKGLIGLGNRIAELTIGSDDADALDNLQTFVENELDDAVQPDRFNANRLTIRANEDADSVDKPMFMTIGATLMDDSLELVGGGLNLEAGRSNDKHHLQDVLKNRFGMGTDVVRVKGDSNKQVMFSGLRSKSYDRGCEGTIDDILQEYVQTGTLREGDPVYEDKAVQSKTDSPTP